MMGNAATLPGMMIVLAGLAASLPAPAQIYRCSDGETTVFSDIPCSESAEIHDPGPRLSVVAANRDIETIARRNQDFIDRRLERIEQRTERAAERREARLRALEASIPPVEYRNVIGHANSFLPGRLGDRRFGKGPRRPDDEETPSPFRRERNPALSTGPAEFSILRR